MCRPLATLLAAGLLARGTPACAGEEKPRHEPAPPQQPAPASAKDWSVTLDSTFASKYLWRGINIVDDPVWQPSVAFAWKGLTLNVWANLDLTDINGFRHNFTEVDYTVDYTFPVSDKVKLSVGTIRYTFPHTGFPTTQEVYAGVSLDAPLAPALKVYRDVDEADGTYVNLAFSHTVDEVARLSDKVKLSLALSAAAGYGDAKHNRFYYAGSGAGLADLTLSAGLPIAIGDRLTIKPGIIYTVLLDGDVRRNMRGSGINPTNLCPGMSFTFSL